MTPEICLMPNDYETPEAKGKRLAKESLRIMRKESVAILKKRINHTLNCIFFN